MRLYTILLLTFLKSVFSGLSCPLFTCYSLATNMCAMYVSGSSFHISSDNCNPDSECTATSALSWASNNSTSANFWCQSKQSTPSTTTWVPQNCPLQQRNKNFVSQASVVKCTSDSDCLLQDGTYASCVCTISTTGSGVCQPDQSNQVFNGYWEECGGTRVIGTQVASDFWTAYLKYYIFLQSDLTCIGIFSDIQQLQDVYVAYKGASANAPAIVIPSTGQNPVSNNTTSTPTPTTQAGTCPIFSCGTLSQNVCGYRTSSSAFKISSNNFTSDFVCSAADLWTWVTKSTTESFLARESTSSVSNTPSFVEAPCFAKQTNKGFKNGQSLVLCSVKTDCMLIDGTSSDCHCTFRSDGLGVCEPNISNDQVFGGYWKACETSGKISDVKVYAYWTQYMGSWVYQQSDLACGNVFIEVQVLSKLWAQINGYTILAFHTLAVLVIIS